MGCTYSKVDVDDVLWRCKERRRLMKQLLNCRAELASAHMAYLQSLRNTGATLRQLAEIETMIPGGTPPIGLALPPSPPPPPPLPPSPPPPPNFSPIAAKDAMEENVPVDDSSDTDDERSCPTPPPPVPGSAWELWDPFGSTPSSSSSPPLPQRETSAFMQALVEEEYWEETRSEFGEEEEEEEEEEREKQVQKQEAFAMVSSGREKCPAKELADDNSSSVSWFTKDTDMGMVVWRSKKTLTGIIKEVDDYFLKAAAGGIDVAVLLESNHGYYRPWNSEGRKGKSSKSAKVVNALSWSWSFKSSQSNRDARDANISCRSRNHCTTLERLFAEEQRLYREVKDEEIAKSQHKKIILLLKKLEAGDSDFTKTDKTRSDIEELQCRMISLKESINRTCVSISKLRDEELFPQLIEFSVGLVTMWRTMYECHQVQNQVSQQANLLESHLGNDPTTDSHRHAVSQLETEVTSWYTSFCNLFCYQREYLRILNQWVRLTDRLPENDAPMGSTANIRVFSEDLLRILDRLPDKVAAEAIKAFLLVIRSILVQHSEERRLRKRSDRLQSRLEKELNARGTLEKNNEDIFQSQIQDPQVNHLSSSAKLMKLEALMKTVEEVKAKYLDSIRMSRAMTLNNLQTSLPNVFQALMGFSSVCVQALEAITGSSQVVGFSECVSPVH